MGTTAQPLRLTSRWRAALYLLFGITILNYIAQIPYYIHFYGVHHIGPSPVGLLLLTLTFILFLAGYMLTFQEKPIGGWILLGFLILEAGFYILHNLSGAFFNDLPVGDPLFLTVSLIGYLNMIVALIYFVLILRDRQRFL